MIKFGDIRYLKTDPSQLKRIVTARTERPNDSWSYELSCGIEISNHFELEMTKKPTRINEVKGYKS